MPHYKDPSGGLHFLDSAAFFNYLPPGCVEVSEETALALLESNRSDEDKLKDLKRVALEKVSNTDKVLIRCLKNGVDFPQEWTNYYKALLAIVRRESWDGNSILPTQPPYPIGS